MEVNEEERMGEGDEEEKREQNGWRKSSMKVMRMRMRMRMRMKMTTRTTLVVAEYDGVRDFVHGVLISTRRSQLVAMLTMRRIGSAGLDLLRPHIA